MIMVITGKICTRECSGGLFIWDFKPRVFSNFRGSFKTGKDCFYLQLGKVLREPTQWWIPLIHLYLTRRNLKFTSFISKVTLLLFGLIIPLSHSLYSNRST